MRKLGASLFVLVAFSFNTGCSWDFNNPSADEWDVQIIGDSVFDLSGDIRTVLKQLSGKGYKDRSVSGAKISAIQNQLGKADNRSSLKTIIANGGANDILQGSADCETDPLTQGCLDVLDYIVDKMDQMLASMYNGPADDVMWLGYYHVKGGDAEKNEAIDYAYDNLYGPLFSVGTTYSGSVSGYGTYIGSTYGGFDAAFADPRSSIVPGDIKSDDIHPNYGGSVKLANLVWGVLVDRDMYR